MQGEGVVIEFNTAARVLWLQLNQVELSDLGFLLLPLYITLHLPCMMLLNNGHLLSGNFKLKIGLRQVNAFGSQAGEGATDLFRAFGEAVHLLQRLRYSAFPSLPFSSAW